MLGTFIVVNCIQFLCVQVVALWKGEFIDIDGPFVHEGTSYNMAYIAEYPMGKVVEYTNFEEFCHR